MRVIATDTETTGTNVWTGARPFMVTTWSPADGGRIWEWPVDPRTRMVTPNPKDVRELNSIMKDRGVRKRLFNLKFDALMLESVGVELRPPWDEVSFMAKACDNLEFSYKLKPLCKSKLKIDDADEKELHDMVVRARRLAKRLKFPVAEDVECDYWLPAALELLHPGEAAAAGVSGSACRKYGVRDSERTWNLGEFYEYGMDQMQVRKTYDEEMELLPTTIDLERHGVMVDEDRIDLCREICQLKIKSAMAELNKAFGGELNINSPKQLVELLFGGRPLKFPVRLRTDTGQPKTGSEALLPHKHHPLVQSLLTAKANTQALKLFFDKYPKLATLDESGCMILHPGFNQWGALSGRYTCGEPNLQQVSDPDTTSSLMAEFVVDVRQVFVPRPGKVWYCPDYSQIEVVIFADISGEESLKEAIRRGDDIHAATAEKIWGGKGNPRAIPAALDLLETRDEGRARALMEEHGWFITKAEVSLGKKVFRKKAKSVTFTKVFGGGPPALMRWINVPRAEAVVILDAYDDTFPTLVSKMREMERQGKLDGGYRNPFGRWLTVDPWKTYKIINHVVQSSAADLMKRGMRACARYLKTMRDEVGLDGRILLTIHDELIFEFKAEHASTPIIKKIRSLMSDDGGVFSIPIKVDVERVDERWSDKSKVAML